MTLSMYSSLRNVTSSPIQRLLQDLGFHSYKQLQDSHLGSRVPSSESSRRDGSEIELATSHASHITVPRTQTSVVYQARYDREPKHPVRSKRVCIIHHSNMHPQDGPLETLQAMLSGLEAHQETGTEPDSDYSSQLDGSHAVLQSDLLGLDAPAYKAVTSEVCRHSNTIATHASQGISPLLTPSACCYRLLACRWLLDIRSSSHLVCSWFMISRSSLQNCCLNVST